MATTFGEMTELVINLTGRADKELLIRSTIDAVVRQIAGSGYYPQSLYEEVHENMDFSSGVFLGTLPEDFHAVCYIKPLSDTVNSYTKIDPNQIVRRDCYGYYIAGDFYRIKPKSLPSSGMMTFTVGWYLYPTRLVEDSDTNWILNRLDYLIRRMAVSEVLAILGDRSAQAALQQYSLAYLQHEVDAAIHPYA